MKVLALAIVSASGVSTAAKSTDPGVDPGPQPVATAPHLGEITVVSPPDAPPSTPRSTPIVRTFDDDDHGADASHAVALGADGSFVVAGEVQRLAEGRNAWVRSYDSAGAVGWTYELHLLCV